PVESASSRPPDPVDSSRESSRPVIPGAESNIHEDWADLHMYLDSTRFIIADDDDGFESNSDLEEGEEGEDWETKDLQERLVNLAKEQGDDPTDEDWLPRELRKKKQKISRPATYVKGPDVMSKSDRTKRRYQKAFRGQKTLDTFFFKPVSNLPALSTPLEHQPTAQNELPQLADSVTVRQESVEVEIPPTNEDPDVDEGACEAWEDELDECVRGGVEIRGWSELHKQIKADLNESQKRLLPTSHINQLLIIRNFATLRLKGYGRIAASKEIARQWHEGEGIYFSRRVRALARHYQIFEQLPLERRGGMKKSRCLLLDERVKNAARAWLLAQTAGSITPRIFQCALNETILPSLSVILKKPLCERTARRWLMKLGWCLTVL
ncbi:hypothetical protein BDZ94DRAFT_1310317, partial [Collybia nuda]